MDLLAKEILNSDDFKKNNNPQPTKKTKLGHELSTLCYSAQDH